MRSIPRRRRRFRGRIRIDRVILAAVFLILLLTFLIWGIVSLFSGSKQYICLDAGHGGSDTGAVYGTRLEKEDNLALALAVEKEIESQGVEVYMTRETDEEVFWISGYPPPIGEIVLFLFLFIETAVPGTVPKFGWNIPPQKKTYSLPTASYPSWMKWD